MSIVCGTDFSDEAAQAVRAAGAIAQRRGTALKLVHVIDELGAEVTFDSSQSALYEPLREQARAMAADLKAEFGVEVEIIVLPGKAHEILIEAARIAGAELLIVSSLGKQRPHHWLLGSTAERVAQASPVPVLVVRDASRIVAWAQGKEPLRVMVGAELASTSKAALRWAAGLRELGRCDITVVQVAWPMGEHLRKGVPSPMLLAELQPDVQDVMLRDLKAWAGDLPGEGKTTFSVSPGLGRVDVHLASIAAEESFDLVVVGTHQRPLAERLWQGSVSRGLVQRAPGNVACIPRSDVSEAEESIPTYRTVLIPTDFSPVANRAVRAGYGLVAPGGVVHLLHVVTREPDEGQADPEARLLELVPRGAVARGIVTECEVAKEPDAFMGIWHAAERLGVDAICMATRGRSGASRLLLGSQAQQVLQRVRQPVVLVPPEREG